MFKNYFYFKKYAWSIPWKGEAVSAGHEEAVFELNHKWKSIKTKNKKEEKRTKDGGIRGFFVKYIGKKG